MTLIPGGMTAKRVFLLSAVAGLVLPYYFLLSFLSENGIDLALLIDQLFANDISTLFAVDLIITAVVVVLVQHTEAQRLQMANSWVYVLCTLLVGPSFALPLFLFFRASRVESPDAATVT